MSQQKEIGTLVVVVLKAQHLHQPSFYKQDPYAQVSLSGLKKRTKVDPKGGQHPVWDDEFRFPVLADAGKDKINRILEVSCYKDEQRWEDAFLGKGTVDIEETLKSGEFDDWVSLETSAGTRGEIYLELTFYANSPPPLTRRPSKLSPSDRIARPAAHFTQSDPTSTSSSPQRQGHSSVSGERKPSQPPATQLPSSLIPARGPRSQVSNHAPSHGSATSAITVKRGSLPPLPAESDSSDVDSRTLSLPAALHPGGRGGPRPVMLPQGGETNMGQSSPETLPDLPHRRTLRDTLALASPLSFSQLQAPAQASYSTGTTGERVSSTPSVVVAEHVEDHLPLAFRTPFAPLVPIQEYDPRGVYAAGDPSSVHELPGRANMQPSSQGIPVPTQTYPPTSSPSQRPMPLQASRTSLGQPQRLYGATPAMTTSPILHPQYTQNSSGFPIPQPPTPPQTYLQLRSSPQPQQQQAPYPYSPQPQQHPPLHQQPYFPPQHHQYLPPSQQQQHLHHPQAPQFPSVSQPYQQHTVAPQQPSYSQVPPQSYFTAPSPPFQAQTSTHLSQPYFSPPPLPPPPPLYNQAGKGTSSASVAQTSQTPMLPSTPSHGPIYPPTPLPPFPTPSLQPPAATPLPVLDNVLASGVEVVREGQVDERKDEDKPVTEIREEARETLRNATGDPDKEENVKEEQGRSMYLGDPKEQEAHEDKVGQQRTGVVVQQQDEDPQKKQKLERQEEEQQQDVERRRIEEEEREEAELRRRGEERGEREEKCRRREEEERARREEEERRKREEDECKRREQEECRKREEERRMQEQIQRKREEAERCQKAAEEATRRRRAEEAEAERRWQEELARIQARAEQEAADAAFARAQVEAEEAERRRQEEADLALVRQAQDEAEREERLAQERRRQEETDMEVARREQAHEEELERRRKEERRRRVEEADRELARRLDMELNMGAE